MRYIKWLLLFILLIALAAVLAIFLFPEKKEKVLMSYWLAPWSTNVSYPIPGSFDRRGNKISNQDLQDKLEYLNMIAYAFLRVQKNGQLQFNNSYAELSSTDNTFCLHHKYMCTDKDGKYHPKLGNFSAFTKLTNKNETLKKVISVGGGADPLSFTNAISHIPAFVESVNTLIQAYHLDGVDLDFEPSTVSSKNIDQYTELVSQLRKRLGPKPLIMVTLVAHQIMQENNWKEITNHANYIIPMCYNFYLDPDYKFTNYDNLFLDPEEPTSTSRKPISCNQIIRKLLALNIPSEKIVLSYPSYGYIYAKVPNQNFGLFQRFNNINFALPHIEMLDQNALEYRTIIQLLNQNGYQNYIRTVSGKVNGAISYNPNTKIFMSYDSPRTIKEKTTYVNENNLAGLMTWLIAYDVSANNEKSLLKAANNGLGIKKCMVN